METIIEKLGGTYRQAGDYLLPNMEVPESPQIGIWGQRRLKDFEKSLRFPFCNSSFEIKICVLSTTVKVGKNCLVESL